jgi:hypothetical protein
MTATGEETLALVRDLARIAHHLSELTAATRDRWAAWGTVTPHLQQAEDLAAETRRCLSHASRHLRLQHQPARPDHPPTHLDRHRTAGALSTTAATTHRRLQLISSGVDHRRQS